MAHGMMQESAEIPPAPETSDATRRRLDRSLLHGIAWTGGMKWLTQILSWASTLIIARLLTPADYGLVGMAGVYLGFLQLLNDFGIASAVVQRQELDDDRLARLAGFSVLWGALFTALSMLLSHPIARFFGQDAVRGLILALSVNFFLSGWQVMPRALLYRDLQFKRIAWLDGLEAVTLTISTLSLAVLGFRYWSLVLGAVISKSVSTVLALAWRPHRLAWPSRFRTIAREVTFGSHVMASQLSWYAYSNADFAIVGRVLGDAALGAYTLGWTIATIPVERITGLVQQVTFSVFAAAQKDPPALRRYFRALTEGLALLTFPASVGVVLVADEFVRAVLGAKWEPAILPLQLLACYGGFRSITSLFSQVLMATGHARRNMQFNFIAVVVLPLLFYAGTRWGTAGVAMGWIVGYPLVVIPFFMRSALVGLGLSLREYLQTLAPAASGTLVMTLAVLAMHAASPATWPAGFRLLADVGAGAITYAGFIGLVHGARIREFLTIVRESRG